MMKNFFSVALSYYKFIGSCYRLLDGKTFSPTERLLDNALNSYNTFNCDSKSARVIKICILFRLKREILPGCFFFIFIKIV